MGKINIRPQDFIYLANNSELKFNEGELELSVQDEKSEEILEKIEPKHGLPVKIAFFRLCIEHILNVTSDKKKVFKKSDIIKVTNNLYRGEISEIIANILLNDEEIKFILDLFPFLNSEAYRKLDSLGHIAAVLNRISLLSQTFKFNKFPSIRKIALSEFRELFKKYNVKGDIQVKMRYLCLMISDQEVIECVLDYLKVTKDSGIIILDDISIGPLGIMPIHKECLEGGIFTFDWRNIYRVFNKFMDVKYFNLIVSNMKKEISDEYSQLLKERPYPQILNHIIISNGLYDKFFEVLNELIKKDLLAIDSEGVLIDRLFTKYGICKINEYSRLDNFVDWIEKEIRQDLYYFYLKDYEGGTSEKIIKLIHDKGIDYFIDRVFTDTMVRSLLLKWGLIKIENASETEAKELLLRILGFGKPLLLGDITIKKFTKYLHEAKTEVFEKGNGEYIYQIYPKLFAVIENLFEDIRYFYYGALFKDVNSFFSSDPTLDLYSNQEKKPFPTPDEKRYLQLINEQSKKSEKLNLGNIWGILKTFNNFVTKSTVVKTHFLNKFNKNSLFDAKIEKDLDYAFSRSNNYKHSNIHKLTKEILWEDLKKILNIVDKYSFLFLNKRELHPDIIQLVQIIQTRNSKYYEVMNYNNDKYFVYSPDWIEFDKVYFFYPKNTKIISVNPILLEKP